MQAEKEIQKFDNFILLNAKLYQNVCSLFWPPLFKCIWFQIQTILLFVFNETGVKKVL